MDRQHHQPAATMVLVLDTTSFRNSSAAQSRWPASSRRAAAATQRSARRSHAARSDGAHEPACIAATSGASEHDSGALPSARILSIHLSIDLSIYLFILVLCSTCCL